MLSAHSRLIVLLVFVISILLCQSDDLYCVESLQVHQGVHEREAYEIIAGMYQEILQRYPDQEGLNTYTRFLVNEKKSEEWLRAVLLSSEEAQLQKKQKQRRKYILTSFAILPFVSICAIYYYRKSTKDFVLSTLLFFVYMSIACVFFEIALRMTALYQDRLSWRANQNLQLSSVPQNDAVVVQRDMVQPGTNPALVYEVKPNLSVKFMGGSVATGPGGFRITPGACDRSPSYTILGVGDSFMFGQGVNDQETYLAYLANMMPNECSRIINMAVPGYNTVQEVEALETKGLQYQPDLVIMHFVNNDLKLPDYIRKKDKNITQTSSYLLDAVSRWMGTGVRIGSLDYLIRRPESVPEHYRYMVGVEAYRREMVRLKELSRQYTFQTLLLTNGPPPKYVADIASELEIPVLDLGKSFQRYMGEHGMTEFQGSVLTVSKNDPHFSPLAHHIVAEEIYRIVFRNKLHTEKNNGSGVN